MRKLFIIIIFIVVITLSGCGNPTTVKLYNEDVLFATYETSIMKEIELDIPEKDGMMFTGWKYEEEVVFDSIEVVGDMELYATWENPIEVFNVTEHADSPEHLIIMGYTGESIYMRIPAYIDGKLVVELGQLSFQNSPVEIMQIPMDVKMKSTPFVDSSIRKVEYYGSYRIPKEKNIGSDEYDQIILEYSDVCTIKTGNIEKGTWTFDHGCPINEVVQLTDTIVINGDEFFSYIVNVDLNIYDEDNHIQLGVNVFQEAYDLEEFRFPNAVNFFFDDMFSDCESLSRLEVTVGNKHYSSENGILYSKDRTLLRLFPQGKIDKEFSIPTEVNEIYPTAFNDITNLEKLIIHADYSGDLDLIGAKSLTEIIVDENNEKYNTIDGVLFKDDVLLKYPAKKTDNSYTIPNGITVIDFHAFRYNKYLEEIDFGDELVTIGGDAFAECESLTVLDLPASVESIGLYALQLSSIETVIIRRDITTYGSITRLPMYLRTDVDYELHNVYVPDDSFGEYTALESVFNLGRIRKLSEIE